MEICIYMSNNNNEFFALDIKTGIIKWKQQINSEIKTSGYFKLYCYNIK